MKSIYLEGNEDLISKVLELARSNLGEGINVINLFPCRDKYEVITRLKKIEEEYNLQEYLQEYIKELEDEK